MANTSYLSGKRYDVVEKAGCKFVLNVNLHCRYAFYRFPAFSLLRLFVGLGQTQVGGCQTITRSDHTDQNTIAQRSTSLSTTKTTEALESFTTHETIIPSPTITTYHENTSTSVTQSGGSTDTASDDGAAVNHTTFNTTISEIISAEPLGGSTVTAEPEGTDHTTPSSEPPLGHDTTTTSLESTTGKMFLKTPKLLV